METETAPKVKKAKLPLWATVANAYRLAWRNREAYFKISRWWLLLSAPVLFGYYWLVWPSIQHLVCVSPASSAEKMHDTGGLLLAAPPSILLVLVGASIAVAWHRLILRNEHPAEHSYLRLDGSVFKYFGAGIALRVLLLLPTILIKIVSVITLLHPGIGSASSTIVVFILSITIIVITTRLTVILPAIALGNKEATIRSSLQKTRGNFWRMSTGYFFCALPVGLVLFILKPACGSAPMDIAYYTLSTVANLLFILPVVLSFISLSYQHFFEKE